MGTFHARVLAGMGHEVVTVDPDPSKGAALLEVPTASSPRFDMACIAVPIPHLAWTALHVAERVSPTWLLIEKPFAASLGESRLLARELQWSGINVGVGYVERFNPVVERLIVEQHGRHFEHVTFTRLNDRPSPDPRLDLWSHDLDLALNHLPRQGITVDHVHFNAHGALGYLRERTISLTPEPNPVRTRPHAASSQDHERKCVYPKLVRYDLQAHTGNPLRDQWTDLLGGDGRTATVEDALRVHATIETAQPQTRAA